MITRAKPTITRRKPQHYHARLTAKLTAADAFDKINDVSAWWSKSFEGDSRKAGDAFTVRFGRVWKTFSVVELVPGKKIVWEVTDCYMPWIENKTEWTGTQVIWEISAKKDSTQIDFTHVGLVPEIECYNDCQSGWNFYLNDSLLKLLAKGKGLPFQS